MILSDLHIEWEQIRLSMTQMEFLAFSYNIIDKLFNTLEIPNAQGIHEEKKYIEKLLILSNLNNPDVNRIRAERFCETAYMIWALKELGRMDIVERVIENWGSGVDDGGTSHYRNFEYECHTALRFLEENYMIKPIHGDSKAEFIINDEFVIECKRTSNLYGVFLNTLKAKKQINISKKPGFILFNIDNLGIFNNISKEDEIIEIIRKKVLEASILGLKSNEDYVQGVIFEYAPISQGGSIKGSIIYAITTNHGVKFKNTISKSLTGNTELKFNKIRNNNRNVYRKQFERRDREKMENFFNRNFNK